MSIRSLLKSRARYVQGATLGLILLASGTAFSTPSSTPTSTTVNPDRGLYIYQAYCVGCHGVNGRGDGPVAGKLFRDFGMRPTDLAAPSFHNSHTDTTLSTAIKGGGKAVHKTAYMPAWGGTLTDRQVADLVAFLRELEPREVELTASMVSVSDQLELGRVLYTVRCLACHGPEGRGNGPFLEGLTVGGSTLVSLPDFSNYAVLRERSDKDIEEVLFRGVAHSGLLPETEPGWWDRALEKDEMRSLIFYLRTLPMQPVQEKG
jgi:mono/diheme cytochrome c family protein